MEIFDLGAVWNWEPDTDFVQQLNDRALSAGLRPYLVHAYNFYSALRDIVEGGISFRCFLDRVSGDDATFSGLTDFLRKKEILFINHPARAKESADRFKMHLKFHGFDIPVAKTALLGALDDVSTLELKIKYVSRPFVLRCADGACVDGVAHDVQSLEDALRLKEERAGVRHIAQEKIYPVELENRPAWFRVFYACGTVIPCWWHPQTRAYDELTEREARAPALRDIWRMAARISRVSGLEFFSTEVAVKKGEKLVVVDLNGHPDMRKKSKFNDGVPDGVVEKIIDNIVCFVKQKTSKEAN